MKKVILFFVLFGCSSVLFAQFDFYTKDQNGFREKVDLSKGIQAPFAGSLIMSLQREDSGLDPNAKIIMIHARKTTALYRVEIQGVKMVEKNSFFRETTIQPGDWIVLEFDVKEDKPLVVMRIPVR